MNPGLKLSLFAALALSAISPAQAEPKLSVNFNYAPPEWQTAICLPDDPCKTLVDRSGELLYHYNQGGREFATRISVSVINGQSTSTQSVVSPRIPIVRTVREGEGLRVIEEAFALTSLKQEATEHSPFKRLDSGEFLLGWAHPDPKLAPSLNDIAVHFNGSIHYKLAITPNSSSKIAVALCEGYHDAGGRRIEVVRVEGAAPKTVDPLKEFGQNKPGVLWFEGKDTNGDGAIEIRIDADEHASDKNTILSGLWAFDPQIQPDSAALLSGKMDGFSAAKAMMAPDGPARNDVLLVQVINTGDEARRVAPKLIIDSTFQVAEKPAASGACFQINGHNVVRASLPAVQGISGRAIQLQEQKIAPHATNTFFVSYSGGGRISPEPRTLDQACQARVAAEAYWQKAPIPWGHVQVPDPGIQALLDSSIRNIWQAREIKNGLPAFQVGPTCYRGLWIVDGAFLLESAAMLGAGAEARNGVAYELTFQQPDGRFEVIGKYHKENGIVIWTLLRHAQLTQDKAWLESVWPAITKCVNYIQVLRQQTLINESSLDDGLMPPGFPDGGLAGTPYEYSNIYWNLAGMRAAIQAANWLGKTEQATEWNRLYNEFLAAFKKAAKRDTLKDSKGNEYVPTIMGPEGAKQLPQRAQWAFCHAVFPGQVFEQNDPLVAGNLAMLKATEREGMVYGTGWDDKGLWNYFASFYGHAWLWQGDGRKAADVLYAFANHASPLLVWREEQSLKGAPFRKVGDMPHNWASAEFIRLAIHLLALDRGNELHLLEGLPKEWTGPGMVTRLKEVATPFGPLTMEFRVSDTGDAATLNVKPLTDPSCRAIVVHLGSWAETQKTERIDPNTGGELKFSLKR